MSGQLKDDTGERKLRVTLLSTEWKASSNGDLTTINRELAIQMAKHPNVEVSVFVPQCSEEDKKDADSYNVKLIEAVKLPGLKPVLWLASVPDGHAMDCVLGHGVALGRLIPLIKKNPNYSHCKWIQVVHTAPEEIGMHKSISEGQQMQQTEIELCEMADQVVTIGPKLTDAYERQLRKQDVFNLTPSIFTEFSGVQHASEERRRFCVLVTESGDSEDFYVKGYDIAVKAIAELKDKSYQLKFASKQRGKEDELANKLLQCGIGCNQLMICSFDENRETLANLLSAVDIAILPSKTEGFGLSALEAISAGLPVLVGGNSGIAEALRKVPNGSQCIVDSEDPADWARAIKAVRYKESNVRLAEARILRENYLQQFSWEKPCNSLVEKMYSLAFDALSSEFHSTSSSSESPQKKEQWEKSEQKTKIMEAVKLEGTSPLTVVSTTGHGKELEEPWQGKGEKSEQKTKIMETVKLEGTSPLTVVSTTGHGKELEEPWGRKGSFPVLKFSTYYLEVLPAELSDQLQRLRMEDTFFYPALLTAELEEKLKELLTQLERQRDKGSLPPTISTIEVEVDELLKKFQKWRIEGALSSEFHSTSSTSESPLTKEQWEKSEQQTKIMETAKLEGTSPLIVIPTTGHGKELEEPWGRKGMLPLPGSLTFDLEEKLEKLYMKLLTIKGSLSLPVDDLEVKLDQVFEEIRMLRMEGNFSVLKFSTIDLEKKLAELGMELHRLRMEGTLPPPELFTADLEDELEQLRRLTWILPERKRQKGSSRSLSSTFYTVHTLRKELEKVKMEALENAMYPTIRSGLAKFDVSLPEELQSYVSYLLNESAKLVLRKQVPQSPRALEELREAMDQDELKTFLAIHIREVAWQVVLLFTDELPRVELPWECYEDEDEDEEVFIEVIYSSKSGILNGWPTEYDPALVTLCNAITNRDWKVARLILCWSQISDAGLKNLSAALTQSELYSLTLYHIGLQSQGLEHLCTALTSVNCTLTSLNVSENWLGDVGIMHLCNALTSVNCTLTSLNVSKNELRDEEIMHLCNALTSVNCTLTSLNVSNNWLGDEGIMHLCNALTSVNCRLTGLLVSYIELRENGLKYLCDALTSSNCTLTKLKVRFNGLGDGGIKELSEVLTNEFCTLTSLDISYNEFGKEGIKHLCKALTDTKCKLQSLNLQGNRYGTDGKKYLFQMLTGTDWEVKGALRLFRSTKK